MKASITFLTVLLSVVSFALDPKDVGETINMLDSYLENHGVTADDLVNRAFEKIQHHRQVIETIQSRINYLDKANELGAMEIEKIKDLETRLNGVVFGFNRVLSASRKNVTV